MKIATLITTSAIFLALAAGPLYAQNKPAESPAGDRKAMRDDCAKEHDKMHDHAKEKGMGGGMMSKCMDEKKGAQKPGKKPLHDHNKEHKQG